MTYLDTHVVVWLYAGLAENLSKAATAAIEGDDLLISPMVIMELGYLHEIRRIGTAAGKIVSVLQREIGLETCSQPFGRVVAQALKEKWTRDPFDRLIVAQARTAAAVLISKDKLVRRHYDRALW